MACWCRAKWSRRRHAPRRVCRWHLRGQLGSHRRCRLVPLGSRLSLVVGVIRGYVDYPWFIHSSDLIPATLALSRLHRPRLFSALTPPQIHFAPLFYTVDLPRPALLRPTTTVDLLRPALFRPATTVDQRHPALLRPTITANLLCPHSLQPSTGSVQPGYSP
jgi:hypothetical protein